MIPPHFLFTRQISPLIFFFFLFFFLFFSLFYIHYVQLINLINIGLVNKIQHQGNLELLPVDNF